MSRNMILNAIRENKPAFVPSPELVSFPEPDVNLLERFIDRLTVGGGDCELLEDQTALAKNIKKRFPSEKTVFSNIGDIYPGTIDQSDIASPKDFQSVDLAVIQGEFGVAENGAVWVSDQFLKFRSVCFLVQHLVLIIHQERIYENMLDAYRTIPINQPEFGCFIAGPSKTADIEQALVIGAHGPRSTVVFLI